MSALPFRPNDVIDDKYAIERVLSVDAVGVLYAAKHRKLDHGVAIKVLLPQIQRDARLREHFLDKARAAAKVRSAHVAKIVDVTTDAKDTSYVVLDRVVGTDLATILEQGGTLQENVAVGYALQACAALAEAHARGVVHGDLRPEHLVVERRRDGRTQLKVTDLGISKSGLEQAPYFAAPEQLRSAHEISAATDVWALGAILYRLLANAYPFDGNGTHLCQRILFHAPLPLEQRRAEVSRAVSAVVARCLEKDPAKRFANAGELARALRDATRARATTTRGASLSVELVAIAAVVVLLSAAVAFKHRRSLQSREEIVVVATAVTPPSPAPAPIATIATAPLPEPAPRVEHRSGVRRAREHARSRPAVLDR